MSINILLAGNNSNHLTLNGLKNAIDDTFINNATVTAQINDSAGTPQPGMTWPANVNYIASSNGNYDLALDSALNLTEGDYYTVIVTVVSGGLDAIFTSYIKATNRS